MKDKDHLEGVLEAYFDHKGGLPKDPSPFGRLDGVTPFPNESRSLEDEALIILRDIHSWEGRMSCHASYVMTRAFPEIIEKLEGHDFRSVFDLKTFSVTDLELLYDIAEDMRILMNIRKDEISAIKALLCAMEMVQCTQDMQTVLRTQDGNMEDIALRIRVGMNSGTLISGIVGHRKPQFALFGDTVNTAARVKSCSKVNQINCSIATFKLLQRYSAWKGLMWAPFQKMMKGKGVQWCFLLSLKNILKQEK